MQAKLLHAVENKRYTPVGGTRSLAGDVRLICATNRDLIQMVREGTLREDFFYRIFVVDIPVPPLRERKEDLPKLIEFFFAKFSPLDAKVRIPEELVRLFLAYDWPAMYASCRTSFCVTWLQGRFSSSRLRSGWRNPHLPPPCLRSAKRIPNATRRQRRPFRP